MTAPNQRLYELAPIEQIRREMQQQERLKLIHPDLRNLDPWDRRDLNRIWVAYVWTDVACVYDAKTKDWEEVELPEERWILWGFRRKPQTITWRSIKRVRRKLHVPRGATLQLVEMWKAWRDGPPTTPPQRYVRSTAPDVLSDESLEVQTFKRARPRHFTKTTATFGFGRKVKFVALVAAAWGDRRNTKPLYLGPLMGETKAAAKKEAKYMFKMYGKHLEVHAITEFKKGPRRRMRNGSIRPGVTRLDLSRVLQETE